MMGAAMRIDGNDIGRLRAALLAWYDANRRDLPWRRAVDPYAIWASEVMLQQTQVSRVTEYWQRFLERFPTVRALAEASEDDVLAEWAGLGYYRRAMMFRRAARVVVDEFGGSLPTTARDLRRLPGMGAYTSAAVASIGFGEAVAAVDANAARVLARVLGLKGDASRAENRRVIESLARRLVDTARPGDLNQAVMELGALVCGPSDPTCDACPAARFCVAGKSPNPSSYPGSARAQRTVSLHEAVALVRRGDAVLLVRQEHERGWWGGLWTLPRSPLVPESDPVEALSRVLRERFGVECHFTGAHVERKYTVTRHRVTAKVFPGVWEAGDPRRASWGRWVVGEELADVGVPAPHRAIVEAALGGGARGATARSARR